MSFKLGRVDAVRRPTIRTHPEAVVRAEPAPDARAAPQDAARPLLLRDAVLPQLLPAAVLPAVQLQLVAAVDAAGRCSLASSRRSRTTRERPARIATVCSWTTTSS